MIRCRVLGHDWRPDSIYLFGVCRRCGVPSDIAQPGQNDPQPRDWAVVQELLPFGYRVECADLTEAQAIREAAKSHYLTAMEMDEVDRLNALYADPDYFRGALQHWTAR